MTSTLRHVSFDCRDPYALAGFWSAVTGWPVHPEDEPGDDEVGLVPPDPGAADMLFLRVPEGKAGKNRLHLDVQSADGTRDGEVERLLALGARLVDDRRTPTSGWAVLQDPEGNEFCVVLSTAERGGPG